MRSHSANAFERGSRQAGRPVDGTFGPSAKAAYRYQAVVRRSWRQHVDGVFEVRTLHDGVVSNRQRIAVKHAGGPPWPGRVPAFPFKRNGAVHLRVSSTVS